MENLSDISLEDDIFGSSNISSDPESEWTENKNLQTIQALSPDSRPEVDQPSLNI